MSEENELQKQVFIKNFSGKSFVYAYNDKSVFEDLCIFCSDRFGMNKNQIIISYLVKVYNYDTHKNLLLEKDLDFYPDKTLYMVLRLPGGIL